MKEHENEHGHAGQVRNGWVAIAALIFGVALSAVSVGSGVAEGIAADAEHRGGELGWLVILGFLAGMAITVVSLVRVLASCRNVSLRAS